MTYCVAASVRAGLVFASDSRTNAGIDQLAAFSKMHAFDDLDGRFFTLLAAGNLATTQAVVARMRRDLREGADTSLATVTRLREAADYVGEISRDVQARYPEEERSGGFSPEANFIFGGQITGAPHALSRFTRRAITSLRPNSRRLYRLANRNTASRSWTASSTSIPNSRSSRAAAWSRWIRRCAVMRVLARRSNS